MTSNCSKPYGLWKSPVSAGATGQRLRLEDVQWDSNGSLLWLEGHSDQNRIISRSPAGVTCVLTGNLSARGRVGYGGGEFTVRNGLVCFVGSDGILYTTGLEDEEPRPVIPIGGAAASPCISPDGSKVLFIFSDGTNDSLALVNMHHHIGPVLLDHQADFYMQPTWHPDGKSIAWIDWDHPNMPWDGCRLRLARPAGDSLLPESLITVAGDPITPVCQPQFSPDGRWLSFIMSDGNWEKMVLFHLESRQSKTLVSGERQLLSTPAWVQGLHFYGWSNDSRTIFYLANFGGVSGLWQVNIDNGETSKIDTQPYTWLNQMAISPLDNQLAMIASAPSIPNQVVRWDGYRFYPEVNSDPDGILPNYLPLPQPIEWKAADGSTIFGNYTPPSNPDFSCPGYPPAIINIHSGPTSQVPLCYHPETAYFTSRGYAWLDVNYRGSSGYGRDYLRKLNGGWGVVDTEDAAGAARALMDQKLADPDSLILRGSSAGGLTVLNTLIQFPGLFKAGICLYAVANLFTLAEKTHKFEAYYHETLVGASPENVRLYFGRSPEFHAEKIRDPLLLFHGCDDRAVPLEQTEQVSVALQKSGTPYIFKKYEGEGHGFRKAETIQDVLTTIEKFLQNYVLKK